MIIRKDLKNLKEWKLEDFQDERSDVQSFRELILKLKMWMNDNEWMNEWYVYFPLKQEYFYNKEQLDNTIV